MKRHTVYITSLLLLLNLGACQKDILETAPYNQLAESTFWKNAQDATQGVNAVYNALQSTESFGLFMFNDILTPVCTNLNGPAEIAAFTSSGVNSQNDMAAQRWRGYYRGIARANLAIVNVEKMPASAIDETVRQRLLGEAKFLRALNYFYLINYFGDVPLILNPLDLSEAENPAVTRTPAAEVRAQLYKDLDEAYEALPVKNEAGRAAKYAARALKGRALLYEGKYAAAAQALKEVIDAKAYDLYPDYYNLFNYRFENNAEVLFDVQYSNTTGTGLGNTFEKYTGNRESSGSGWSWMHPTVNLIDSYEMKDGLSYTESPLFDPAKPYDNRDPRLEATVIRPGATYRGKEHTLTTSTDAKFIRYDQKSNAQRTGYLVRKALSDDATGLSFDGPTNLILLRFADVLLMYAEAQNEAAGPDATVYEAINRVRQRPSVNMPGIMPGKTREQMRETIRRERVVELALEGHYYFDLKRWDIWDQVDLKVKRPASETDFLTRVDAQPNRVVSRNYYLLPIPQNERDRNKSLTQNDGY